MLYVFLARGLDVSNEYECFCNEVDFDKREPNGIK